MLSKNLNVPSVPHLFAQIDFTSFNSIACAWPNDPKVGIVLEILLDMAVEDVAFPFCLFVYLYLTPCFNAKKERKKFEKNEWTETEQQSISHLAD